MPQPAYVIDELISAKAIAARVETLARDITQHYKGTDKLIVVGLLRGSFVFIADSVFSKVEAKNHRGLRDPHRLPPPS